MRSFCVTALVALALLAPSRPAPADPQLIEGLVNIRFRVSPQLFAVMAAVQVAGLDARGGDRETGHVRRFVRERLAAANPDLRERIRKFCAGRDIETSVAYLESKYISFGLVLTGPPAFALAYPAAEIPEEAKSLIGFEALVSELWREGNLGRLWEEVRPQYLSEIEAYRPLIREMILSTLRYMRTEARVSLDRQVTFIPELMKPFGIVNARNMGDTYIVVVGPSKQEERPMKSIRHEYLHFVIDPLLSKYVASLPEEEPFMKRVRQQPGALPRYSRSFHLMVTESLLQMVELKLDREPEDRCIAGMLASYDQGLVLAPYFKEALREFETGKASLPDVFKSIIEGIRWDSELKREELVSKIRAESSEQKARETARSQFRAERRELLLQANQHLKSREFDKAEEVLDRVIRAEPENANALFGLAQVMTQRQELEQALAYYEKAAANAGEEIWIAAWSFVHRGNIFRARDDYESARYEWSRVLKLQGDLRGALEAANKALSQSGR